MPPEVTRDRPPYLQIADAIEADILSGRLAEGASVPSVRQVAADWSVAMATATKAHGELRQRGLIQAIPGVGTVVASKGASVGHGAQGRSRHVRGTGHIYRDGEVAEIVAAGLVPAAKDVADALGLVSGAPVVRRERITRRQGDPVAWSVSWLPGELASVAPELVVPERVLVGTFALAAERTGRAVSGGREDVCAAPADEESSVRLGVQRGEAVLISHNWYFDEAGTVIEYGESVRRAGRWSTSSFSMA
ncbi:GntR family transcriptional regulator [Arsenicicoccus dermatophilus]|uniref:GntR family transcriptional regulator n=1 Tax=Arsenicicoccus dermatophilus TaxID=1076331 RepID=UPI001F4D052B|nr:GntR family transcriptional regulator [Arsenicicoccus dermatophilus]MCH8614451.1 GntR family transcriptional regulator [Arsenicicoccus dermatophilus]